MFSFQTLMLVSNKASTEHLTSCSHVLNSFQTPLKVIITTMMRCESILSIPHDTSSRSRMSPSAHTIIPQQEKKIALCPNTRRQSDTAGFLKNMRWRGWNEPSRAHCAKGRGAIRGCWRERNCSKKIRVEGRRDRGKIGSICCLQVGFDYGPKAIF